MTQARLRLGIFTSWIVFWVASTVLIVISPWIRTDIERADILPCLYSISVIWIPPLSCLAAFWFPEDERNKARSIRTSLEKVVGAFVVTFVYMAFVLGIILYSTYFIQGNTESADPGNITLLGQINESIKLALVVSPIALAPINWLTRGRGQSH